MLTQVPTEISLDIIACLPLGAIAASILAQRAWKYLVDTHEPAVYRSAAFLHRFIGSDNCTLQDALSALDFEIPTQIGGWKDFCKLRVSIEKGWKASGPSKMRKAPYSLGPIGPTVYLRKSLGPGRPHIHASVMGNIAVSDTERTIWSLPENYLQQRPLFAYDQGYLVFPQPIQNAVEVWREPSAPKLAHDNPTPVQKSVSQSIQAVYGPPAAGHFLPCYSLPPRDDSRFKGDFVNLLYPTLLTATVGKIHIWDISTGQYLRTIQVNPGKLDNHVMYKFLGAELSAHHVVVFDQHQVRVYSLHDGQFLLHFSAKKNRGESVHPIALQLLPPRQCPNAAQHDGAALLRQTVFPKRVEWRQSHAQFTQVGISRCGTTLVVVSWNSRVLIVHDLPRMITGDLTARETAVDVKLGLEYNRPFATGATANPFVIKDRIAFLTERGILIFNLDRSGSSPIGSARLSMPSGLTSPIVVSVSFLRLSSAHQIKNLTLHGSSLVFDGDVSVRLRKSDFKRYPRKASPKNPAPEAERAAGGGTVPNGNPGSNQDDNENNHGDDTDEAPVPPASDDSEDDMPDLQSVSDSSDDEEVDEESADSADETTDNPGPLSASHGEFRHFIHNYTGSPTIHIADSSYRKPSISRLEQRLRL
ncbi:hypothetical protein R3P38DRAFT_2843841 [Favolaschia claudopus]|uniref:F-box domain-containing protein n=1 Tax=Favolaschia claudopus TaxID=2862362 RepID=A0AAW0E0S4_9AGAR